MTKRNLSFMENKTYKLWPFKLVILSGIWAFAQSITFANELPSGIKL